MGDAVIAVATDGIRSYDQGGAASGRSRVYPPTCGHPVWSFSFLIRQLEVLCRFADVCFRRLYGSKNAPFIPAVYLQIEEREFVSRTNGWMNGMNGWMGGGNGWMGDGMWLWTIIGVLVAVLLVVLISKVSKKSF